MLGVMRTTWKSFVLIFWIRVDCGIAPTFPLRRECLSLYLVMCAINGMSEGKGGTDAELLLHPLWQDFSRLRLNMRRRIIMARYMTIQHVEPEARAKRT